VTTFELWNTRTGNAIGEFQTEAAALAFVREAGARNGRASAEPWFLGASTRGRSMPVVRGTALVTRALEVHQPPRPVPVNA
jgi:hypothetical protein